MPTAGELLAKMMLQRENGEDTAEIQREFVEQSKRQLGSYCSEFSFEQKENDLQNDNTDYVQPEE